MPDAPTAEANIRVAIKSGSLDRLVDVLVSGLEGVSVTHTDDNFEMPLGDGKNKSRNKSFRVDRVEFNRVCCTVWVPELRNSNRPVRGSLELCTTVTSELTIFLVVAETIRRSIHYERV